MVIYLNEFDHPDLSISKLFLPKYLHLLCNSETIKCIYYINNSNRNINLLGNYGTEKICVAESVLKEKV